MFSWLEKLLHCIYERAIPKLQQGPYDLYHPKQRQIYQFFNGQQITAIDPMILYKRIMEVGPELDIDIKVANSASKDASKAYETMLEKIRKIFGVAKLDEGGLTEEETIALMDHFFAYIDQVKKNLRFSETSSDLSEASGRYSEDHPVTSNSSASGSTANGTSTVSAAALPTEFPLPSA